MMTRPLEVSILAAPLAAIDRRALSEAWFSALRLVRQAQPFAAIAPPVRSPADVRVRAHMQNVQQRSCWSSVEMRRRHLVLAKAATMCSDEVKGISLRRRSPLAQRIEHVFAHPSSLPRRATFSMGRGNGRVHIVLQTKGERTTLLAICRPEVRVVVARALAQARFALAARGIGIELRDSGASGCF